MKCKDCMYYRAPNQGEVYKHVDIAEVGFCDWFRQFRAVAIDRECEEYRPKVGIPCLEVVK